MIDDVGVAARIHDVSLCLLTGEPCITALISEQSLPRIPALDHGATHAFEFSKRLKSPTNTGILN